MTTETTYSLRERIGFWLSRRWPTPFDMMQCGKKNHYWVAASYRKEDCPLCRAERNLNGRDEFIVSKGLWDEFVGGLPCQKQ